MPTVNPLTVDFASPDMDPVSADMHATHLVDKLRQSNMLLTRFPNDGDERTRTLGLIDRYDSKLKEYVGVKKSRGEETLYWEKKAQSRRREIQVRDVSTELKKIFDADEKGFETMLRENGDYETQRHLMNALPQDFEHQRHYALDRAYKMFGYSNGEINSGAANASIRDFLGAGENEPTQQALLRWTEGKTQMFDSRDHVTRTFYDKAQKSVFEEKDISDYREDIKKITDPEERRLALEAFTTGRQSVEKYGKNIGLAKKLRDRALSGEIFSVGDFTPDELAEFNNLSNKEFNDLGASIAAMEQVEGTDRDAAWWVEHLSLARRFGEKVVGGIGRTVVGQEMERRAEGIAESVDGGGLLQERFFVRTGDKFDETLAKLSYKVGADVLDETGEIRRSMKDGWREANEHEVKALREMADTTLGHARMLRRIGPLRDQIAPLLDDNLLQKASKITAESVGYMTMSANPAAAGALLFPTLTQQRADELELIAPDLTPTQRRTMSMAAGAMETSLIRLEGLIVLNKLPGVSDALSKIGRNYGTKLFARTTANLGMEITAEMIEEQSLNFVREVAHTFDENVEGGDFHGTAVAMYEQMGAMSLGMLPLVLLGSAVSIQSETNLEETWGDVEQHFTRAQLLMAGRTDEQVEEILAIPDGATKVAKFKQFSDEDAEGERVARIEMLPPEVGKQARSERMAETVAATAADVDTEEQGPPPNAQDELNAMFFPVPDFIKEGMSELNWERMRQGLPPLPISKHGSVSGIPKLIHNMQTFLTGRKVPSKDITGMLVKSKRRFQGAEAQFAKIGEALDALITRDVKTRPKAQRETYAADVQGNVFKALRGDTAAQALLQDDVAAMVEQARDGLDFYSQALVDFGFLGKDVTDIVEGNIGSYILRQFKAFDARYRWNYKTVKRDHRDTFDKAIDYISDTLRKKEAKAQKAAAKASPNNPLPTSTDAQIADEADLILQEMLDPSRAAEFYMGAGKVGKVDITSFFKRKDLAPEILAVLGEVTEPGRNVAETGKKVSKIAITQNTQAQVASYLVLSDLASRSKDVRKRHTHRLGRVNRKGEQTNALAGFGDIYVEPELGAALDQYFKPDNSGKSQFEWLFDRLASVTGAGKFAQVILNPASYPTNFLGGVATEIFNGRVDVTGRAARAYFKFGTWANSKTDPYTVTDQIAFYGMTGAEFNAAGGVNAMTANQIAAEMEQGGVRNVSVMGTDLVETVEAGFGENMGKITSPFARLYQAPDNAIKRSAFVAELSKWAKAEPNEDMSVLVAKAIEDVRSTTQNYDMVPQLIKSLSQRGVVVPTYVSFSWELFRNVGGTMKTAYNELKSGNPVLQKAGAFRVGGMLATGAALHALNTSLSAAIAGLAPEEKKALQDAFAPPWMRNMDMAVLKASGGEFVFFDPSYMIPHQVFYSAAMRAMDGAKEGKPLDAVGDSLGVFWDQFNDTNIFMSTIAEIQTNKKQGGGEIFNPETEPVGSGIWWSKAGEHLYKSMFTPGFIRTFAKYQKGVKDEIGYLGSTYNKNDIAKLFLGIRPYRHDTTSPEFLEGHLKAFTYRARDAKSYVSERKQSKRTPEEQEEAKKRTTDAQEDQKRDLEGVLKGFAVLGVSAEKAEEALIAAKLPSELKEFALIYLNDSYKPITKR